MPTTTCTEAIFAVFWPLKAHLLFENEIHLSLVSSCGCNLAYTQLIQNRRETLQNEDSQVCRMYAMPGPHRRPTPLYSEVTLPVQHQIKVYNQIYRALLQPNKLPLR